MKRNQFLKILGLFGLFSSSLKQGKTAILPKSSGLVQVKPFNSTTITQAVAAEIMSLVAWNHLNEERFANSFKITQEYRYVKDRRKNGATYTYSPSEGFEREDHGLTIFSPTTSQEVRIWPNGEYKCRLDREELKKNWPSEYEHIVRNVKTGHERRERFTDSGHGLNNIKVVDLYLKLGFYQYK